MSQEEQIPLPTLIVITGRPGSGKTTLAHQLARAIHCPAICRDELKEGFIHTTGQPTHPGDDIARQIYATFFDSLELLLTRRITLVAEAAFQHKVWAPRLDSMQSIARVRIIVCEIDPMLARARHIERGLTDPARERFHGDPAVQAAREGRMLPIEIYEPPKLDVPALAVNTSDGYQPAIESISAFALG
jgi:predicted kinase